MVHPDIPLVDAHVHMDAPGLCDEIRRSMDAGGCPRINILTTVKKDAGDKYNRILRGYKEQDADRFYLFGALDYSGPGGESFNPAATSDADRAALADRLARQPTQLKSQGFDGIKMIEGKPTSRRFLPFPLDSEVYAPFFAATEQERFPLLWHVGDPPDFWDPNRINEVARAHGWLYDRPGDPSLETMRAEAENVLKRHPKLRVLFAHFYFLGHDLDRARRMLTDYPNILFDTTPGGQMYKFFNDQREAARRFFIEFQDRLAFGTDLAASREKGTWPSEGAVRLWRSLRAYFGTDEVMPDTFPGMRFLAAGETMRGLNLPREALEKLFHGVFESLAGAAPAKLK